MTDADLIYNALLRVERKLEAGALAVHDASERVLANYIIQTIREEIGNGLAQEGR